MYSVRCATAHHMRGEGQALLAGLSATSMMQRWQVWCYTDLQSCR